VDRKEEFALDVNVIADAQGSRDAKALVKASSELDAKVASLRARLRAGDRSGIDEALDLLEIKRPVIWLGYAQERLLRSLKHVHLDESQLGRLEFLAVQLIGSTLQGGQLRELVRVLRGRASDAFLDRIQALASSGEGSTKRRAQRTVSVLSQPTVKVERSRSRRPTKR
jgi:hypothetical protein